MTELNPATGVGVMCVASMFNEYGRYKRIEACNS